MTMIRNRYARSSCAAALLLPLLACELKKSETPLSPSVAGPIAGVEISAPRLLEPTNGARVKSTQPITFTIENSSSNGVRPVTYTFEVSADANFDLKMYARSGIEPGEGRTSVTLPTLDSDKHYYWRARAEDGANSSAYSTAAFDVLPKPQLDPPPLISPANGDTTSSRRPTLTVGGSTRNAAVGALNYEFQIAIDSTFIGIVSSGIGPETGDRTTFVPGLDLTPSSLYFWRVRAIDADILSGWSAVQTFRTPSASGPAPPPSPGPAPGGPCNSSDPLVIVECERAKFGHMNSGELVAFMTAVVDSMNRNGIPGGRFGLLVKTTGSNCNGYSCDIVCSGNGGGQRQWDVLGDTEGAQTPNWSEVFGITVRVCEIR
jgi:hypothetical protein